MEVTKMLRQWAIDKLNVPKDATDEVVKKAVGVALSEDKMTAQEFASLQLDRLPGQKAVKAEDNTEAKIASAVEKALAKFAEKAAIIKTDEDESEKIEKAVAAAIKKLVPEGDKAVDIDVVDPRAVFQKALTVGPNDRIQVKSAYDMYDGTKSGACYPEFTKTGYRAPNAGQNATWDNRPLNHSSQADKAVIGAIFKWQAASTCTGPVPRMLKLSEHEKSLVQYAMHELPWTGEIGEGKAGKINAQKLTDFQRKALLDDATSGGIEAVPTVFDDAVILTPVLYGEIFPMVEVVDVTGRLINGFSMGNPTFGATAEGTAPTPFVTTSFIAAFDTTVWPAIGALEIGLDAEDDGPVNLGSLVAEAYGNKAMEWLDRVIACGNGTDEPQGISAASGTISVSSGTGSSGPLDVSDAEALMFGVTKKYRSFKGGRCAFLGQEVSYKRFRAIPVSSSDQRRVFGMDHKSWSLHDYPFKVQEDITESTVMFANLGMYRLYRRRGMQIRVETAGQTLGLKNTMMVIARMRFGGKLTLGGAAAKMTDAPLN